MKKCLAFLLVFPVSCFVFPMASMASVKTDIGDLELSASGDGMIAGGYANDWDFLSDFRIRGNAIYNFSDEWKLGATYSLDKISTDNHEFARDAFLFLQSDFGRAEIGITDSVANKLAVTLPDVGGLRLNDYPILYEMTRPQVEYIPNATLDETRYATRINLVSAPTNAWQFGATVAAFDARFNSAIDVAAKYRTDAGKTKIALSLSAGFIDDPDGANDDLFMPNFTAKWRGQIAGGLNVQYASWVVAITARAIYDDDPIGITSDGVRAGMGVSYDFLNLSASASYIFSDVGVFHNNADTNGRPYLHTGIISLRYKFNKYFDVFVSGGAVMDYADTSPFVVAGLHGKF